MRKAIDEKLTYFNDDELKKVHDDAEQKCKSLVIDEIIENQSFHC